MRRNRKIKYKNGYNYNQYQYKNYKEIPAYMRDYLVEVGNVKNIEALSLQDINSFLNGLEEWQSDPLFGKSYRNGRY